ncbi:helix-turn-helix domain-containing protein [Spirosoma endbachense]|uniref:Helix-turn-helix domain-containing protein n=1 Tax=Spirosoma endbachense TaxID=2666025 RepID=A0A6P1VWA5_9BACT|nr:AraC family transcriptional regulator [Spirosoma endbachense]QHV97393.1 helix-turn-helix domain-containing protein [Spirosoma endbachense]
MRTFFRDIQPVLDASFIIRQEQANQFAAPFHFHRGYELLFIIKGQGKFYGGNQVMNFGPGDVYLFGPNFPHYFVIDRLFVEMGHSIVIQFRDDSLEKVFSQLPELNAVNELLKLAASGIKFGPVDDSVWISVLEMSKSKNLGLVALLQFIYTLHLLATSNQHQITIIDPIIDKFIKKQGDDTRLDSVYQYVLRHFNEKLSTKKAASLACMQEAAFCRYFKRRTSKTFSQFVNEVRIKHAKQLLYRSHDSISVVCYSCGFHSITYFNRQFKAIIGFTPYEYRKKLAEEDSTKTD